MINGTKTMNVMDPKTAVWSYLSLSGSLGTLLCCALPSLLVLFGLGATVASLLSAATWLVALSHHKQWVFLGAGLLIAGNFIYVYWLAPQLQAKGAGCSIDGPNACATASRLSRVILWTSAVIYLIGFVTAYVLGSIFARLSA